jgi:hypothetical protein
MPRVDMPRATDIRTAKAVGTAADAQFDRHLQVNNRTDYSQSTAGAGEAKQPGAVDQSAGDENRRVSDPDVDSDEEIAYASGGEDDMFTFE